MRSDKFKCLMLSLFVSLILVSCGGDEGGGNPVVLNPPVNGAQSMTMVFDMDPDEDQIQGDLTIAKASDESKIDDYVLYWGSSTTTKQNATPITTIAKTGSDLTYTFAIDSVVPSGATHLLVYTSNADGEIATPQFLDIPDNVTKMVADFNPGASVSSSPIHMTEYNGKLYFAATNGSGHELCEYDGTENPVLGTNIKRIADLWSGGVSGISNGDTGTVPYGFNGPFIEFNDKLYFSAARNNTEYYELFSFDGTTISLVKEINTTASTGSNPNHFAVYDNKLFFSATGTTGGRELYSYDGTNDPAVVSEIHATGDANPVYSIVFNSKLYFGASDGTTGNELYNWNGTAMASLDTISGTGGITPRLMTEYNGKLYFQGYDATNGSELWSYDPILNTCTLVKDIRSGTSSSIPANFTVFNGKLYFTANDGTNGTELWSYDGTNDPVMFHDFNTSAGGAGMTYTYPEASTPGLYSPCMFVYNNKLYMRASANGSQYQLYVYDGTNTPRAVSNKSTDLLPSTYNPFFAQYNSRMYFMGSNNGSGNYELFVHYIK